MFGTPTAYYPPGHPFFLGALQWVCNGLSIPTHLPMVAALAQALLGGVMVWAVIGVGDLLDPAARRLRLGVVAGAVLAVWPNLVIHSTLLLSETLYLALFACFLLVMVRTIQRGRIEPEPEPDPETGRGPDRGRRLSNAGGLAGSGVLLGSTVLVRPQALVIVASVGVVALLVRGSWVQRVAAFALPVIAMVVVVAPWTVRNAGVFHEFVAVSTNGGDNMCIGFHTGATGGFEITPACETGEFYVNGPAAEARHDDETGARATAWAEHHLGALPALSARKLYNTYKDDHDALMALESYGDDRWLSSGARSAIRWISDLFYDAVIVLAATGAAVVLRRMWEDRRGRCRSNVQWVFLIGVTVTSALVPLIVFGDPRFKLPTTPCFALLAALAVASWTRRREE